MYQSIPCIEHLFCSFSSDFFFSNSIYLSFDLFESLIFFCLPPCFGISFFFFVLFRMLWMLVNVKKGKFPLRKTWLTLSKIPGLEGMLVIVYKIEFISWKTWIIFTCSLACPLTSAFIIFSEPHCMSCFHTQNVKLQ